MIKKEHPIRAITAKITDAEKTLIKDYIDCKVTAHCAKNPTENFTARDLFGGVWTYTPLQIIYDWHYQQCQNHDEAFEKAGKDLGWLLLDVIASHKLSFEVIEGYTHRYKLAKSVEWKNNGKLKLLIIVGTRPEIIRLSAVITKCRQYFDTILAHTGQNYDYNLNGVFFKDLKLADPEVYLNAVGADLGETMGNIIAKSYQLMVEIKPDAVLVLEVSLRAHGAGKGRLHGDAEAGEGELVGERGGSSRVQDAARAGLGEELKAGAVVAGAGERLQGSGALGADAAARLEVFVGEDKIHHDAK